VRRVGGDREITVDVRVVAATNKSLANAIRENRFREDLYYRLAVLELHIPPLRERHEDIALLAKNFLAQFENASGGKLPDSRRSCCGRSNLTIGREMCASWKTRSSVS